MLRVIALQVRARKNIAGKMFYRELSRVVECIWGKKQKYNGNSEEALPYVRVYQKVCRLSL